MCVLCVCVFCVCVCSLCVGVCVCVCGVCVCGVCVCGVCVCEVCVCVVCVCVCACVCFACLWFSVHMSGCIFLRFTLFPHWELLWSSRTSSSLSFCTPHLPNERYRRSLMARRSTIPRYTIGSTSGKTSRPAAGVTSFSAFARAWKPSQPR